MTTVSSNSRMRPVRHRRPRDGRDGHIPLVHLAEAEAALLRELPLGAVGPVDELLEDVALAALLDEAALPAGGGLEVALEAHRLGAADVDPVAALLREVTLAVLDSNLGPGAHPHGHAAPRSLARAVVRHGIGVLQLQEAELGRIGNHGFTGCRTAGALTLENALAERSLVRSSVPKSVGLGGDFL
jgi:hypothetical protein